MTADRPAVDLITLTPRERTVWDAGHLCGYLAGHEAGEKWADDRAAALFRRAVRVVHALAAIPPRDAEADRARAAERDRPWSH